MGTTTAAVFVAVVLVGAGCSGSDSAADPAVEPTPTTAIGDPATPEPTATADPTATPEPAEPTATPEPELSEDEAAVIEAWERYVVLSTEARGKSPSAEALDFDSYMLGGALDGTAGAIDGDRAAGRYVSGSVETSASLVTFRADGDAVLEGCIRAALTAYSVEDDSLLLEEDEVHFVDRARLTLIDRTWLVAAADSGVGQCEL